MIDISSRTVETVDEDVAKDVQPFGEAVAGR